MFRTQANPMDDAIVKATDENLVNENWEFILDVCDRVSASPSGPQQAVAALIKRLAHRNANVQLYTLELANALSQNCGPNLHRELASKAFTDALLRLAGERNTHAQVKQKVLERMGTWTEEFGRSPDFGIMEQAYQKLRTSQPSLMPPSKPGKREISTEDRRKEDEELQAALALSVQDVKTKTKAAGGVKEDNEVAPIQAQDDAAPQTQGTTAATVSRVRALYDFVPSEAGELAFRKDDVIAVLESVYKDWWKGSLRGQTGIFPLNYVEKLQDPTKEELERDAHMEAEVFGEIKNVEKLLALLSVRTEGSGAGRRGEREEEEISELYQRTLSIRPKLIELIGKYSQKKDDFTQLNEKFIKARRDYEALLESSMAHPQQYQQYPGHQQRVPAPMYQQQGQHQQLPYNAQIPPAGYPAHGPPGAGYGASQPPYASQTHLPPPQRQAPQHPQQDTQRFYSPAPSEPVGRAGYGTSQYPPSTAPQQQPAPQQQQPPQAQPQPLPQSQQPQQPPAQSGPPAFHFIPGGVQAPPEHTAAIRRKPSPQVGGQASLGAPSEMGAVGPLPHTYNAQGIFQNQARPNSIHTLNSGNPQELATSGYESPVDNRRSYPPAIGLAGQQQPSYDGYDTYTQTPSQLGQQGGYEQYAQQQRPPPSQTQPHGTNPPPAQASNDLNSLPSRQRTQSFESPTSLYSAQVSGGPDGHPFTSAVPAPLQTNPPSQTSNASQTVPPPQGAPLQAGAPLQPSQLQSGPPPSHPPGVVPGSPPLQQNAYQPYQAYNPGVQQRPHAAAGDDPGDFYR